MKSLIFRDYHTESQSSWGKKGPLEIIYSNPVSRQGHLEQITQERLQVG